MAFFRCCFVSVFTFLLLLFDASAFSATMKVNGSGPSSLFQKERVILLDLLPQSGFTCTSPQEISLVCDACSELEKVAVASAAANTITDGTWRLRFTSSESPYGFFIATANGAESEMSTTLQFKTTFADDTLRVVRMADEVFVFERAVSVVDSLSDAPVPTTIFADGDKAATSGEEVHLTAESFSDIPAECDLDFDEAGEMIILCDDGFVEGAATVSD